MNDGPVQALSFRLNGKVQAIAGCICLYRAVDAESMTTEYLLLTKNGTFVHLDRVIGGKGIQVADEWPSARAVRFLLGHGEGDIVDEFPDIFRNRPKAAAAVKEKKGPAAPKERPAEPYLFPLQ